MALHGSLWSGGGEFMLRQFEIARSIRLHPYNALAFSAPIEVFVSVFLIGTKWLILFFRLSPECGGFDRFLVLREFGGFARSPLGLGEDQ